MALAAGRESVRKTKKFHCEEDTTKQPRSYA